MLTSTNIVQLAQETLRTEARSLEHAAEKINVDFYKAIEIITSCKGRIVITGIGKSANIANKIVATFNSTGTPAIFMHAAEALHGDLGVLLKDDAVLCISNSGDSPEIKVLLPFIKSRGNKIIAITGNKLSFLAGMADCVLDSKVEQEACAFIAAPTCSTTVQLAIGDALAVCLIHNKGITQNDFIKSHPGGALGKKLTLQAEDIAKLNQRPQVEENASLQQVIYEISSKRLGATAVCENGKLKGVITDGDIRRMLEKTTLLSNVSAKEIMGSSPKTIHKNQLAVEAFHLMNQFNITQVIVVDSEGHYFGFIHLHDLIKEGLTEA